MITKVEISFLKLFHKLSALFWKRFYGVICHISFCLVYSVIFTASSILTWPRPLFKKNGLNKDSCCLYLNQYGQWSLKFILALTYNDMLWTNCISCSKNAKRKTIVLYLLKTKHSNYIYSRGLPNPMKEASYSTKCSNSTSCNECKLFKKFVKCLWGLHKQNASSSRHAIVVL